MTRKFSLFLQAILISLTTAQVASAYVVSTPVVDKWETNVQRPAVGSAGNRAIGWSADSVFAIEVRYSAQSPQPAAVCSKTIQAPVRRTYIFSTNVNITRPESAITFRFVDAIGNVLESVAISTATGYPGRLTPGQWTPVELELNPAEVESSQTDLSEVKLQILPQWVDGQALLTDVAPLIMLSDATLENSDVEGKFTSAEILNSGMENWGTEYTLHDSPQGWSVTGSLPVAGSRISDSATYLPAGTTLSQKFDTKLAPTSYFYNRLRFNALIPTGSSVDVVLKGDEIDADNTRRPATVRKTLNPVGSADIWSTYVVTIEPRGIWNELSFVGDKGWTVDNVRFYVEYAEGDLHHAEDVLTVTSSADTGEGSLRKVLEEAPAYAEIHFAVEEVNLESPLNVGVKSLMIKGLNEETGDTVKINTPAGATVFEFNPGSEGAYLYLNGIKFSSEGNGPSNGGVISASDSRGQYPGTLIIDGCVFDKSRATTNGGAIYLNNPMVSTKIQNSIFMNCKAANGAAMSFVKGTELSILKSVFVDCETSGSTGGTVSITATDAVCDIFWSDFIRCKSTASSGGAGGIFFQSLTSKLNVGRCLFDGCEGGRGAALSAYNNSRGSVSSLVTMVNCSAINSVGSAPAVSMSASGSYQPYPSCIVNNILAYNDGTDLIAASNVEGTNNIISETDVKLTNTIKLAATDRIFGKHDELTGRPVAETSGITKQYTIDTEGLAYDAGVKSYRTSDGKELIDDRTYLYVSDDWQARCASTGHQVNSIGHIENYNKVLSVKDVNGDGDASIAIWPNPAVSELNVNGSFERMWITTMSGVTVYTGRASHVNISSLSPGYYIASFLTEGKIISKPFIKK